MGRVASRAGDRHFCIQPAKTRRRGLVARQRFLLEGDARPVRRDANCRTARARSLTAVPLLGRRSLRTGPENSVFRRFECFEAVRVARMTAARRAEAGLASAAFGTLRRVGRHFVDCGFEREASAAVPRVLGRASSEIGTVPAAGATLALGCTACGSRRELQLRRAGYGRRVRSRHQCAGRVFNATLSIRNPSGRPIRQSARRTQTRARGSIASVSSIRKRQALDNRRKSERNSLNPWQRPDERVGRPKLRAAQIKR